MKRIRLNESEFMLWNEEVQRVSRVASPETGPLLNLPTRDFFDSNEATAVPR